MKEWKVWLKLIRNNPSSVIGIVIILAFIVIAIFAPVLAPPPEGHADTYQIPRDGFSSTPKPPDAKHIFGTTQGQYDIFYGVIWGTRSAFKVGLAVIGMILFLGIILGSIAGYFGGIIDEVIMRITDVFLSLPPLLLAMAITVALGPSINSVIIALTLVSWPAYARLIRGDNVIMWNITSKSRCNKTATR